jgi:anti-anti-sigma factor
VDEPGGLRETPVTAVEDRDGAIVVRLAGELDLYNAHLVRDVLLAAAKREPERLVVELSGVTFIDSTGLGTLIEARTKLANRSAFLLAGPVSRRAARWRSPGSTGTSRCTSRSATRCPRRCRTSRACRG